MIRLTIDGTEIITREGRTILEAAREGGIDIPTLCHHERLSPVASCRLCIVEVEGCEKPMTSCTTPALEGITVTTRSERLLKMRREILNLILTAHPLDCPQCDKGGECRLQDLAYEHGIERAEFPTPRRDRKERYATPLIRYWELRCLLCGRCVQGCREVSGRAAIEIVGRGFEARIAPTKNNDCISCGECLSLCPVGALTENLSPVKSRSWQSERTDTACPHCGFGCRLTLKVVDGNVISKVVSEKNLPPNSTSLCVRGRFGHDFASREARLTEPFEQIDGKKRRLDREEALTIASESLRRLSNEGKGIGFIVSPRATSEEMFLIARIAGLFEKSRMASSAFYHTGKVAAAFGKMGISRLYHYDRIRTCKTIIVAGADLLLNNHLLANKVREAVRLNGARVIVVDPLPCALAAIADAHLKVAPGQDAELFNALSRKLLLEGGYDKESETLDGFAELKKGLTAGDSGKPPIPGGLDAGMLERAYELIRDQEETAVIFASGITNSGESLAALLNFCLLKGLHRRGLIMPAALQANATGAVAILGEDMASPDELLSDRAISGLFIHEDDPFHYLNGAVVKEGLGQKEFIAVSDLRPTPVMDYARMVLPSAGFAEKEGSFISGDGEPRSVKRALGAGSGYEFLNGLLGRLGGGGYGSPAEIQNELKRTGILSENGGTGEIPGIGKARFAASGKRKPHPLLSGDGPSSPHPYRLILRDLFMNHHLRGDDGSSSPPHDAAASSRYGIAGPRGEQIFMAAEDAALLKIADGENISIESADGAVTGPVAIKREMKTGVLECFLGETSRHGHPTRGEVLALSRKPAKVIAVSVRKG